MDGYARLVLSEEQKRFFQILDSSSDCFFVTGKAGTGKSVLLRYFVANTSKRVAVVAPTGIAAINAQGQTIHSFFGLSTAVQNPSDYEEVHRGLNENRLGMLQTLDAIVIDEVSMVRVDIMDMMDAKLRAARRSSAPFGGCQIIAFGDLFQLPPVVGKDEKVQQYLDDRYHTVFFFGAPACRTASFRKLELTQVFRQKDPVFTDALNHIRVGESTMAQLNVINDRAHQPQQDSTYITLTTTNAAANRINQERLAQLPGEAVFYRGFVEGNFEEGDMPTDFLLQLKVGAQIMMIKNDSNKRWVNGTLGNIVSLSPDQIVVRVPGWSSCTLDKEVWEKYAYEYDPQTGKLERTVTGTFRQYPIRLAYAITIHKSQGQTYDAVHIDYSQKRAFDAGQTYVALSRCKSLQGLTLSVPIAQEDIKVNQEIVAYLNGTIQLPPVKPMPIPEIKKSRIITPEFEILHDGSIKLNPDTLRPKKITARKLPSLFGMNRFESPFAAWCDITRVFEKPFEETPFTLAGKIIEPMQYEYAQRVLAKPGRKFIAPKDLYGENPAEAAGYDFFRFAAIFGGMWDYLIEYEGKIACVMEMKTKKSASRRYMQNSYPGDLLMQAGLYAYLLGVEYFYMVTSFLEPHDYEDPSGFVCTPDNTVIQAFNLQKCFGDFEGKVIRPAMEWYNKHVLEGISPQPVTDADQKILAELNKIT